MRALTWISIFIIITSIIMLVLGGMYHSNSVNNTMSPGQISAYSFTMKAGQKETFTLKGTDYFTFYLMNESAYQHLSTGNFTDSYYANTTRYEVFDFTAPHSGKYYMIIANVNTNSYVEVSIIYGNTNNTSLLLTGLAIGVVGLAAIAYEYMDSRKKDTYYPVHCPNCGAPMKAEWKYCPQCRYSMEEEE